MSALRNGYKVIRSILFAAVLIAAGLYIILYLLISIPGVQSKVKDAVVQQVTKFLGAPVSIQTLEIIPFNEVILNDVKILTPEGDKCIEIERLGAGIALWSLITEGPIEITYAEIIGLKARISQASEGDNLNIQFIIDAFKPKKEGNQTVFDLKLHNIVIRKSDATFDRNWKVRKSSPIFDENHIYITNLRADIAIPVLKNDNFKIDLRRLSFKERSGFYIDDMSFKVGVSSNQLDLSNFHLKLNDGIISLNNQLIPIKGFKDIGNALKNNNWNLSLKGSNISTEEFSGFYPALNNIPGIFGLNLNLEGNPAKFNIRNLQLYSLDEPFNIEIEGVVTNLSEMKNFGAKIDKLRLTGNSSIYSNICTLIPNIGPDIYQCIKNAGHIDINISGNLSIENKKAEAIANLRSAQGEIGVNGNVDWNNKRILASANVESPGLQIGEIIKDLPITHFSGNITGNGIYDGKKFEGHIAGDIDRLDIRGKTLQNISIDAVREDSNLELMARANCPLVTGQIDASCLLAKENSKWKVTGVMENLDCISLGILPGYPAKWKLDNFAAELTGNNPDNIVGHVSVDGIYCKPAKGNVWDIQAVRVAALDIYDSRKILLTSDLINGEITGKYKINNLIKRAQQIAAYSLPYFIHDNNKIPENDDNANFHFEIKPIRSFYQAINSGFIPVRQIVLEGSLSDNQIKLDIDAPLIGQGKGNLKYIRDSHIFIEGNQNQGITINGKSKVPVKNGYINTSLSAQVYDNDAKVSLGWVNDKGDSKATINLIGSVSERFDRLGNLTNKDIIATNRRHSPQYQLRILDSDIILNGSSWELATGAIKYYDNLLSVDNIRISNDNQFVEIAGRASRNPGDTITAYLNNIDLSYIFDTLNINYVNFGGMATGKAVAANIFSKKPYASTEDLFVKDLSYNEAILGDGHLLGYWDNDNKSVGIQADIIGKNDALTKVKGNIFVTRDSLGLNFNARKTNLALIRPFLENVLEKVEGQASCNLTLYGTFKDITLVGEAYADTASVKIGFTNVTYHGADSVLFLKDKIIIPGFKVKDQYGNTANFGGTVKHDYFHDAYIDLNINDIDKMLCLDMDARQSPIWYGRIFGSGSGRVTGVPGYTMINFNVTTEPKSEFTFVLDDAQTAVDYTFLTFSDKKKEAMMFSGAETFSNIKIEEQQEDNSVVELDLSIGITDKAKMNVIMDPSAGDKISAEGRGSMRVHYDTKGDKIDMYGRYTLSEGNYQFSFQDLILKNFKIKPGSSIMFNGDPLAGILDLTAAYRVNANLSDLDKSFSTDPDLKRSSVPVEALLKVSGPLSTPDIAFDIELPTVTRDVERKVRSIVSSEEMLNQQVLYLLALNRFYTPQFAGSSEGDLVSVASSTLSSQISNILSQITDKVSLNPSFKSDKNDFSDMEVDLALSSQLFDNRLIINGNLGYRDRSVSNTNFIGDFDIEYLLNKRGNLRLKAYNHFNDAYYYLKSALTTQGLGIIYRKDFDDAFAFLRHKPKWLKKISIANNKRYTTDTIPEQ